MEKVLPLVVFQQPELRVLRGLAHQPLFCSGVRQVKERGHADISLLVVFPEMRERRVINYYCLHEWGSEN